MATQRLTLALDAGLWLDFVMHCQVRQVRPEAEVEALLAQRLDEWTQADMPCQTHDGGRMREGESCLS